MTTLTFEQTVSMNNLVFSQDGKFDAMMLAQQYHHDTGRWIDWHEFAYLCDDLRRHGILNHAGYGNDGFTLYQVAPF